MPAFTYVLSASSPSGAKVTPSRLIGAADDELIHSREEKLEQKKSL